LESSGIVESSAFEREPLRRENIRSSAFCNRDRRPPTTGSSLGVPLARDDSVGVHGEGKDRADRRQQKTDTDTHRVLLDKVQPAFADD
jgi:hypothetical protein